MTNPTGPSINFNIQLDDGVDEPQQMEEPDLEMIEKIKSHQKKYAGKKPVRKLKIVSQS